MLIYFSRIWKSAWNGFRRNGWLSLAAVFIMAQALLIVSILVSLNMVISTSIKAINQRIDVAIFLKDTTTEADALAIKAEAEGFAGVEKVIYISPQEALDKFLEQNRDRAIIREVVPVGDNFLPASIEIQVDDPYRIEGVVKQIRDGAHGNQISETSLEDNQKLIERLRSLGSFVQNSSLILAGILVILALLIIFNTIRITIFTRRREIEVMKLVGATDWYIRWPFIMEGAIYAVTATVVTMVIVGILYYTLVVPNLASISSTPMFTPVFFLLLGCLQLLLALIVGVTSSYWATKKHLEV
jgi:cell division transport system permease protein